MKLLLDTHTFIWWDSQRAKLSPNALELCQNPANTLTLSVASVWEMQIKHQLGKLTLHLPLREILEAQVQQNALDILPIEVSHVLALDQLPLHHRDPFDRLLIAQANVEQMILVSCDPIFETYSMPVVVW
jgi:PIN domain nuclease of toxin-antitoxin system